MAEVIERCDLKANDTIKSYRIEKVLGEGSFGRVYQAKSLTDGKNCAVKLLKMWEISSAERNNMTKRFEMEYATGQIKSDYLVHSFDKGTYKGNPFIVMEYCSGGDLTSFDVSKNSIEKIDIIGSQILLGLRDLHQQGKVHRDLKPENVLRDSSGNAKLTDFGISGDRNHRLTRRGWKGVPKEIMGTFIYMPPEQMNPPKGDATVLPTTDIFSFGVMMYQLLTKELPFGKLNSHADLSNYTEKAAKGDWNRTLLKKCSNDYWYEIISGCLQPNYKDRLQSADAVLAKLPHTMHLSFSKPLELRTSNRFQLRIMQGESYGSVFHVDSANQTIVFVGRDTEDVFNHISIKETQSAYISRKHCTLEWDGTHQTWILRDGQNRVDCPLGLKLHSVFPCPHCTAVCHAIHTGDFYIYKRLVWSQSLNGTFVNSTEVSSSGIPIKNNDIITIGDVTIKVEAC